MFSSLRGYYADALTSVSYLSLLVFALHSDDKKIWLITLALLAVISFFACASTYKRVRAIADIATSRIGSAAQGYVELYGRASVDADNLITSPLSGVSCLWFRYWEYCKDNNEREWRETGHGVSQSTFEISDSSGRCQVDPDNAEVTAPDRRVTYQGDYKYVEELLYAGGLIYVLGELTTVGGANSVLSVKEDVGALLVEWKKDPVQLKKRFDLDGNGEIDMQEWELARRAAVREIEKLHREIRAETGFNVIRAPRDGRLFLISSLSPQKLRHRYMLWGIFHLLVCFAVVGALVKFTLISI